MDGKNEDGRAGKGKNGKNKAVSTCKVRKKSLYEQSKVINHNMSPQEKPRPPDTGGRGSFTFCQSVA